MEDDLHFESRPPGYVPPPRPPRVVTLADFTTDQLRAELRRRRNRERPNRITPCDTCENFRAYAGRGDPPETFNPCAMGHKMAFRMPDDYPDDAAPWGFYLKGCRDRKKGKA